MTNMKRFNFKKLTILSMIFLFTLAACDGEGVSSKDIGGDEIASSGEEGDYYVTIHYSRSDGRENNYALYCWGDVEGAEHWWNGNDGYGVYYSAPLSDFFTKFDPTNSRLGFIIKNKSDDINNVVWTTKDASESDRFIKFNRFTPNSNNVYHIYLKGNDKTVYSSASGDVVAELEECYINGRGNNLCLQGNIGITSYTFYEGKTNKSPKKILYEKTLDKASDKIIYVSLSDALPNGLDIGTPYYVDATFTNGESITEYVSYTTGTGSGGDYYASNDFTSKYLYEGELGAIYTSQHTIFRVWSPVSYEVKLRIYESGTPTSVDPIKGDDSYKEYIMDRGENGTYEIDIWDDMEGKYYTYVVSNMAYTEKEIVDPYAKSAGVNGQRGMVVDFESEKAKPDGWDDVTVLPYDKKSLVVYETHVADVTASSTWGGNAANQKKFKGMYEEGTTYTSGTETVTTGFDHIKELGVNAVQLLPIFDQSNDEVNPSFNWGYNPVNYNVPEGAYSSDPYDGYVRVKELRELVEAYNKAGINIIMDVVYNHMYSANESNFDVLMPGYYYRYEDDRVLADGSGCGNETNSDHYMYHKFMIDSTTFWAETYKLSGFRFDLMGLHDVDTMNDLTEACRFINPNIAIYGEPWTASASSGSTPAVQSNASKFNGFGAFNDRIRESLMKTNSYGERGWAMTNSTYVSETYDVERIVSGIKGQTPLDNFTMGADATVNYVSCHDNSTVYDRIKYHSDTSDDETIAKMATLANAVVFTSKGTSFMLAGEEMLRTKGGDDNSYASSYEVNALDYSRKITYPEVFNNYKALINVKTSTTYLAEDETNAVNISWIGNSSNKGDMLQYSFTSDGYTYNVIHRNGYGSGTINVDLSGYTCVVDTLGYVDAGSSFTGSFGVNNYETIVARK
ncbi:MAG: type I pullulanase [Coprobacillus sp.]|nr:type I pullulanase [Coprobacillus sp.]